MPAVGRLLLTQQPVSFLPGLQVQGMSFLAAVLLLNMDQCDAFTCLANLLSKPCYNVFFRIDQKQVRQ